MQQLTQNIWNEHFTYSLLLLLGGAVVCLGLVVACGLMIHRQVGKKISEVTSRPHLN